MTKLDKVQLYLVAVMLITYYFNDPEEALRRAKAAGKRPGRYFGGITLPSGKSAFAVYEGGQIVERYAVNANGKAENKPAPGGAPCGRYP